MTTSAGELIRTFSGRTEYEFIHFEKALSGKFDGAYCITNRYWLVVQDHIAIYVGKKKHAYSPQCNSSELTARHIYTGRFAGLEHSVQFFDYVFVDGDKYFNANYSQ